ncbi:MAG: hypothetical protein KDB01_01585 [Planctomycetaceae bacterium]|nr:hypothetical protein [Planctomycetaceae bacterium]
MRDLVIFALWFAAMYSASGRVQAELQVGAAIVDITPHQFPVLVNGGMTARSADKAAAPIYARSIVIATGAERVAIVVVDSCMMGRLLLDDAKQLAAQRTKIRADRMLISATHTHTAPSSMGCLGTDPDENYVAFLRDRIAEAVAEAESHLQPAEVGWAVRNAADFTALRRWIIRPDRIETDPFGNPTMRANMHAGANPDNVTGESGPEDPDLSLIAFRTPDGRPIAVLSNFSMHYFSGVDALHPDYFGLYCNKFQDRIASAASTDRKADDWPFVAVMSHGCSGDIWRRDYTQPVDAPLQSPTIDEYTDGLLNIALDAFQSIRYSATSDLVMAERRLPLKYRVPNKQLLEWSQRIVTELGSNPPQTTEQVYAREQVILQQLQSTEVVLQALRIGDIAIASTPNETYALTGLKLKHQSPLSQTMVIELANGGDGYIPPPEQHLLGGYNTWAARSAGLEVLAEPKIAEANLELLEIVTGMPRRKYAQQQGPAAQAIAALKPAAWWRMDEMAGPHAMDTTPHHHAALYEPGVVFFLEGPQSSSFCGGQETNRAAHFAGGRLSTHMPEIGDEYSVSMWFWNGMPNEGRDTAGWLISNDYNHGLSVHGEHLGIGGTATSPGHLILQQGDGTRGAPAAGRTAIDRWTWNHVVLVRDKQAIRVHLNGDPEPEIRVDSASLRPTQLHPFFFGGRSDNANNWEGRLDEIAVFTRALSPAELRQLTDWQQ